MKLDSYTLRVAAIVGVALLVSFDVFPAFADSQTSLIGFGVAGYLLHKLPPFENVGVSQTAVLPRIPLGDTYDAIVLDGTGSGLTMNPANITSIRITLGGKLIWDITGSHLDTINKYYGFDAMANAGQLYIWFADPFARTIVGQNIGALDTSLGYSGFGMEVDLGAGLTPKLTAFGIKGQPLGGDAKPIFRSLIKATHAPGSAAEFNLPVPYGSNGGGLLRGVHFMDTGGLITKIQVKKDSLFLLEEGAIALVDDIADTLGRVPQANHTAWDAVVYGNQSDSVPTLRPSGQLSFLEFKVTVSAAETIVSYTDGYFTLPMI